MACLNVLNNKVLKNCEKYSMLVSWTLAMDLKKVHKSICDMMNIILDIGIVSNTQIFFVRKSSISTKPLFQESLCARILYFIYFPREINNTYIFLIKNSDVTKI